MFKEQDRDQLKENNLMLRTLLRIEKTKFIEKLEGTNIEQIDSSITIQSYLMTINDLFFADKKGCYVLSLEEKNLLRKYVKVLENKLNELNLESLKNNETTKDC